MLTLLSELEPEHLKEERRLVLNSTQKLAFNNYQTFIQTADCTREVFKDVSKSLLKWCVNIVLAKCSVLDFISKPPNN